MIFPTILRYTRHKITCYLDHARVAKLSASAFFNSVVFFQSSVYVLDFPTEDFFKKKRDPYFFT
jgi:hypothetical protein